MGGGSARDGGDNAAAAARVVEAMVAASGGRALVFFPGPDAVGLREGVRRLDSGGGVGADGGQGQQLPPPPPLLLVFVDGTWVSPWMGMWGRGTCPPCPLSYPSPLPTDPDSNTPKTYSQEGARRLYGRTPCLHSLPKVALPAYADPTAGAAAATAAAATATATDSDDAAAAMASDPPQPLIPPPSNAATNTDAQTEDDEEEEEELRAWLRCPPLFTIRKEPAPLLGKGGRSTAEAVALALALLPVRK